MLKRLLSFLAPKPLTPSEGKRVRNLLGAIEREGGGVDDGDVWLDGWSREVYLAHARGYLIGHGWDGSCVLSDKGRVFLRNFPLLDHGGAAK